MVPSRLKAQLPQTEPASTAARDAADQETFFQEKVLPVLQANCFECHSHARQTMEGGLSLDYRSGWERGGDSGPAIVPGKPSESLLIDAVRRRNGLAMPPDNALPAELVAILEQWVADDAFDNRTTAPTADESQWWSLQALMRPAIPATINPTASGDPAAEKHAPVQVPNNAVDNFILEKLREHDLNMAPTAQRRELIRRLSIDLHGLPPTFEEVSNFSDDRRVDAYERVVDRLLASPAYGERWARHWMDTIHFAETHGFEHDVARPNAWSYRDYLIGRLNADVSWSRFIREQLAADHFFPDQPELTPALGFLGAGTYDISSLTTAPMTFAYLDRDDMVTQTMSAFTSTTVNCARCHAHKFDPIPQEDYFALQAVFAGVTKGDIAYDADPAVARQRREWELLLESIKTRDKAVLLADHWHPVVNKYAATAASDATLWTQCSPKTFAGTDNAGMKNIELKQLDDGSLLAGAPFPERTTYTVSVQPGLEKMAAVRIELIADSTLPGHGPGCASNGNLHLCEIEVRLLRSAVAADADPNQSDKSSEPARAGATASTAPVAEQPLRITKALADFDQEGWGAAQAIDGDINTAWGIHPQEGRAHAIVAQLSEPLPLSAAARVQVTLKQSHGRSHIIGRFRISITDRATAQLAPVPDDVTAALRIAEEARSDDQRLTIATEALRQHAAQQLSELPAKRLVYAAAPKVLAGNGTAAQAIAQPPSIFLLQRGEISKPGREVLPGALSAIKGLPHSFEASISLGESARRAALAEWLAHHGNPLTWRSIANRLWSYHFGRGLCDTPSDLGRMGGAVTHPELLDWLACELRDGDESLKSVHRLLVTSAAYRQSSRADSSTLVADSENRWLSRQQRQRLDADSYRDALMSVSDSIDRATGGPSVQQFTTSPGAQLTPMVDYKKYDWNAPQAARRSIYRFVWRGIADPFMESLDFPDLGLLTPQRSQSSSALQALTLYNNEFVLVHARRLADRATTTVGDSQPPSLKLLDQPVVHKINDPASRTDAQLREVFKRALQREPTAAEVDLLRPVLEQHGLPLVCRVIFNSNEFLFLD